MGAVRSELIGTGALWVALVAAVAVAVGYTDARQRLRHAAPTYLVVLALQCLHFVEEFITGFHLRFPMRLGLEAWPNSFFVIFNGVWLCLWTLAAAAILVGRAPRVAGIAVWFLTFAAIGNGIAHPVLAISSGGYFPGLVTAPLLGLGGILLWRKLATHDSSLRP